MSEWQTDKLLYSFHLDVPPGKFKNVQYYSRWIFSLCHFIISLHVKNVCAPQLLTDTSKHPLSVKLQNRSCNSRCILSQLFKNYICGIEGGLKCFFTFLTSKFCYNVQYQCQTMPKHEMMSFMPVDESPANFGHGSERLLYCVFETLSSHWL